MLEKLKQALGNLLKIDMKIMPKARPRGAVKGWWSGSKKRPWVQIYMPTEYTNWMRVFKREFVNADIPEGPVGIALITHHRMPKAWSKKRKEYMAGMPYNVNRCDIDNNLGSVMDALFDKKNGGDGRVTEGFSKKVWALEDGIEMAIYPLITSDEAAQWSKYDGKQAGKSKASTRTAKKPKPKK